MVSGKGEIIKFICPFCKKEMSKNEIIQRIGYNTYSKKISWRHDGCVYLFTEEWLNDSKYMQHEDLVLRDTDNVEEWKAAMKKLGVGV